MLVLNPLQEMLILRSGAFLARFRQEMTTFCFW